MGDTKESLKFLQTQIEKRDTRGILTFEEYLDLARREPQRILRNIFQLFYDMVKSYVGEGTDEYPDDPESIGFVKYDCSKLFAEGADIPFLADRLFANRFIRQVEGLKQGFQQNQIYVYYGPSGCGKSTFLNNLLRSFEEYVNREEGRSFELLWELDEAILKNEDQGETPKKLLIPCPSHDYPILLIPKPYRPEFLHRLLPDEMKIKAKIFEEKDYEWIFRGDVCAICKSIFWSLFDKLGSLDRVLSMVRVRPYKFDRRLGEGISVFNPGDRPVFEGPTVFFSNSRIQKKLDEIFGVNSIRYIFSPLARTNNGIYVLMDVKLYNQERLLELHNVISEGVHKVSDIEEPISSLFIALMNPEDKDVIEEKKMESFRGRIKENKIPFVLEPATEANIWLTIFGQSIRERFLPRVLENFARIIVASRMKWAVPESLKGWIPNIGKYSRYCDENGLLLRMEIYSGIIPTWLSEEDRKKFTAPVRKAMIAEGEKEGDKGFDGRVSIELFRDFFSRYGARQSLINMNNVIEFFKHGIPKQQRDENIPKKFLDSLLNSYNYTVLNEVKEALFFYNPEQIQKDILNYICAVNYNVGDKVRCKYTGEEFEVTIDFLKSMASYLTGEEMTDDNARKFAQSIQNKYIVVTAKERRIDLTETELYRELFDDYIRNLKEKVLEPFAKNPNFREAIKAFGTQDFDSFETRLKEHVSHMIRNLIANGYTEQGARDICLYVLDNNLVERFAGT